VSGYDRVELVSNPRNAQHFYSVDSAAISEGLRKVYDTNALPDELERPK
jgi:hypothetical protein